MASILDEELQETPGGQGRKKSVFVSKLINAGKGS